MSDTTTPTFLDVRETLGTIYPSVEQWVDHGALVEIVSRLGTDGNDWFDLRVTGPNLANPIASFSADSAEDLVRYITPDTEHYAQSLSWSAPRFGAEYKPTEHRVGDPMQRAERAEAANKALWEALLAQAVERGWCSEYDQFAKVHGGPVRTVLQYVQFGISVPVTFPYAGDSREDVQKAAEALPYATRAEAVAKQISDILRYDSGLDDETRERVAARLAENFSVVTR